MRYTRALFGLSVLVVLLLLIGCGGPMGPSTGLDQSSNSALSVTSRVMSPYGGVYETGTLGPGAQYEIHVPSGWHGGDLVLYVHGYASPYEPPELPDDLDGFVLQELLRKGFAVAYSSFSETGWAVRDGAIRTRQLLGHFKTRYGMPEKTYLVGASQGGLIALSLGEQNPNLFDGILSISGVVGGGRLQLEYLLHVRVVFDQLFGPALGQLAESDPGGHAATVRDALGEGVFDADAGRIPAAVSDDFADRVLPGVVAQLVEAAPESAVVLATTLVDGVPLFNWTLAELTAPEFGFEAIATVSAVLWFNIYGTQDILARTNGHFMIDNTGVQYDNSLDPGLGELLDASVERVSSHPAGVNYLRRWYQPTGKLRFPMVTVHLARDPAVPVLHEQELARISERAGSREHLYQHSVPGFGHTQYVMPPSAPEPDPPFEHHVLKAFERLVLWVHFGIHPSD